MAVFTDGLDGTAGETLHTRTGWARTVGADTAVLAASGSGFYLPDGTSSASSTWHAPTIQPSGADQYAEAIMRSSGQFSFPTGVRCDTSSALGAGYLARYNAGIQLFRRSAAGALTQIGSYTVPAPADIATNPVRLEVIGTTLKVYFKGSVVIGPVTDTNITSGSVAVLSRGGSGGGVPSVDNWQSGEVGAVSSITGSTSLTFTPSATIQGTAAMIAASALTFATAGVLSGSAAIAATAALAFSGAATIQGVAALSGAAVLAFSASASIGANAIVSGTTGLSFTLSGALTGGGASVPSRPVRFLSFTATAKDLAFETEPKALNFTAPTKRLDFTARDDVMEKLPTKIADEIWQCNLSLSPWIADGNTVASFNVEAVSGSVTVAGAALADATTGTFRVSGGNALSSSMFRAFATMADGQVFGQTFSVFVEG